MHLILFKALFFIFFYPVFTLTQELSQEEHCIALETTLNSKSRLYDHYVTVYLNHLKKCNPPLEGKFELYRRLLKWLSENGFSQDILTPLNKVIHSIIDQMPNPNVESLRELSYVSWKVLSETAQQEDIVLNVLPFMRYHSETPLSTKQGVGRLEGAPLIIAEMTQRFSSELSICKNTKEFQYLLRPLNAFLQDTILSYSRSVNYDQLHSFQQLYNLYHSLYSQQLQAPPSHLQFISWTQFPLPFIEFLSEAIDSETAPFHNNKYRWLKPLLSLLKMHIMASETMQNYCILYQPFLNTEFVEHHYTAQFPRGNQTPKEKRGRLLKIIEANVKEKAHGIFFRANISPENDRIYLYFIRLHPRPE